MALEYSQERMDKIMVKKIKKEDKEKVLEEGKELTEKEAKKPKKTVSKKEEPKEKIEVLGKRMGIHPYRLDSIMHFNSIKKGYEITQKELKKLYDELY